MSLESSVNMANQSQNQPLLKQSRGCGSFLCRRQSQNLVRYLGNVPILRPLDLEMCGSVAEIYDNYQKQQALSPVFELKISNYGIRLVSARQEQELVLEFKLSRILCCGVDRKRRRIFAFNYYESGPEGLFSYRTHALQCNTKKEAKDTAMTLRKLFTVKVNLDVKYSSNS